MKKKKKIKTIKTQQNTMINKKIKRDGVFTVHHFKKHYSL